MSFGSLANDRLVPDVCVCVFLLAFKDPNKYDTKKLGRCISVFPKGSWGDDLSVEFCLPFRRPPLDLWIY